MQHFFRKLAQRLAVEFFIQLLDLLVFMAQTLLHVRVPLIQAVDTGLAGFVRVRQDIPGLTAAADAAAGAGHDLDEVVLLLTGLQPLDHLPGVGRAVDHSHIHGHTVDVQTGLPDAVVAPDGLQVQQGLGGLLAGDKGVSRPQGGLHDAAGVAEDDARAGGLAHQAVIVAVRQGGEVHALLLGPQGQLPGGDDLVHIPHGGDAQLFARRIHLGAANFKLLGRAGSQGHIDDLLRVNAHLLGKVGLDGGALHPDGALGAGDVGQQLRVIGLRELDPGGAAAGELG